MKRRGHVRWVLFLVALLLAGLVVFRWLQVRPHDVVPVPWSEPLVDRDLDRVVADTLRVLVLRDPLTWEERTNAVTGLEWELLERFAKGMKVPIKAVEVFHPDSLWMALQKGRGDVIAAQLTPRKDHRRWVRFTAPYRSVVPVMASLRNDPTASRPRSIPTVGPAVDSMVMGSASPFRDPDHRFDDNVCVARRPAGDGVHTADDLLVELMLGRAAAVVVSDAHAAHEAARLPLVEFSGPIGAPRPLCYAVRKNATRLAKALDQQIEKDRATGALEHLFKGYVATRSPKAGPLRAKRSIPVSGDSISPFDKAFRSHAGSLTWDWHLLVAMAYQESRFDSTAVSTMGAQGIMQLMPNTAERLGLDSTHAVEDHIGAAVRFINKLDTLWRRAVPDPEQRLRFVLASYNAGPGHIIDAQRLAEQLGLDPRRWEQHVERAVLLLTRPRFYLRPTMRNGYCNGPQVFRYVRDVTSMYRELRRVVPAEPTGP
jgi:membrane-bound lytic murein transglycosylase F